MPVLPPSLVTLRSSHTAYALQCPSMASCQQYLLRTAPPESAKILYQMLCVLKWCLPKHQRYVPW